MSHETSILSSDNSIHPLRQVDCWPLIYFALAFFLVGIVFSDGLVYMFQDWQREEYSHGILIPLISLFLLLQKLPKLKSIEIRGTGWGLLLVGLGLLGFALGELSALYTVIQYSFLVVIFGLVMAIWGARAFVLLVVPLGYLIFMIPLPNFLYFNLSSKLQLLSSAIGVDVLRLMGVSVYLEGNIIDLGTFRLQVVDACSGLRYLFPLMSFGFLVAYIYKTQLWKNWLIFLSTIPITIFMNSLRITLVGVTVDIWGIKAAEGFLHDFQGWVVFMLCLLLLAAEILLMHRLSGAKNSAWDSLSVNLPKPIFTLNSLPATDKFGRVAVMTLVVLMTAVPLRFMLSDRAELVPERTSFNQLPLRLERWIGHEGSIDQDTIEALKLKDYVVVNYLNSRVDDTSLSTINLYMAYYDSQRKGASIHSPKTCLPGGGWEIKNFDQVKFEKIAAYPGVALEVNRVLIQKGESKQLVYYWFQQRGRVITSEYAAKWYIFWDSLTMSRTDGALVRVIAPIPNQQDIEPIEKELVNFVEKLTPSLSNYIPQ